MLPPTLRRWLAMGLLALGILSGIGCRLFNRREPPIVVGLCAFEGGPYQQFPLLFDLAGTGTLAKRTRPTEVLPAASEPLDVSTAVTSNGTFLVLMVADPRQGPEPVPFGTYALRTEEGPRGPVSQALFRQAGTRERSFGVDGQSVVLAFPDHGAPEMVATLAYRTVTLPEGAQRILLMHQGTLTGLGWVAEVHGRILREGSGGRLEQVGWVGWRRATLPDGRTVPLLMTRRMQDSSRWTGRHQDTWYRDP